MSWLVAPQWTKRAACASDSATRAVRCRTTGMTGLPVSVASAAKAVQVVQLRASRRPNRRDAARGNHAGVRLGRGQRRLDVQHRLKLGVP